MDSRICLLLAFGKNWAGAIAASCEGLITAFVPASVLQKQRQAIIIIDRDASSELMKADYCDLVYSLKPDWQMN